MSEQNVTHESKGLTIVEAAIAHTPTEHRTRLIQALGVLSELGFPERLFREIQHRFNILAFYTKEDLSQARHESRGQIVLLREITRYLHPERFDPSHQPSQESNLSGATQPQPTRQEAYNPEETEGFNYGA